MARKALLFENVNYGGRTFEIEDGVNYPVIPPPLYNNASSMTVEYGSNDWITFWESPDFKESDDSLWIAPPPLGRHWALSNLHAFPRPHGNNHWGDLIKGASYSGPPTGSNDNRTIIHPNGSVTVGNQRLDPSRTKLIVVLVDVGFGLPKSKKGNTKS